MLFIFKWKVRNIRHLFFYVIFTEIGNIICRQQIFVTTDKHFLNIVFIKLISYKK